MLALENVFKVSTSLSQNAAFHVRVTLLKCVTRLKLRHGRPGAFWDIRVKNTRLVVLCIFGGSEHNWSKLLAVELEQLEHHF